MSKIHMVDLISQYKRLKPEMDNAVLDVMASAQFINGPAVKLFEKNLAKYLNVNHVIGCANGTDALQIALMALGLEEGDEVIVPAFTYVATAEVIALLKLKPVMIDVDPKSFNTTATLIEEAITKKTKAIVPVHLFGQSADMEPIMDLANQYNLFVIEDNAQALGSDYSLQDGKKRKTGTLGHIGCTSFFPAKNLGCYGDGGAIFTNDDDLAEKIKMIANHGQNKKYYHKVIGCNSRLDSMQAAVLNVKLKHLDDFSKRRRNVADVYDHAFNECSYIDTPMRHEKTSHVFHQYTLKVKCSDKSKDCIRPKECTQTCKLRDGLIDHLQSKGIPSGVYYPVPLYKQEAFSPYYNGAELTVTEELCQSVISLPIHTEMKDETQQFIISAVLDYFK